MSHLKNFHYQIIGNLSGQPLVFLHGLMGYAQNWRKISAAFESTHKILLLDQRGHGKSFKPETGYSPEDYADDLLLIIDELGWSTIDLVGHSMGGRNALNFAHRFPDRVRKLVIEDIGPNADANAVKKIRDLLELVPTPFGNKEQARIFFTNIFPEKIKGHAQSKILGQYFYSNIEVKSDGTADWRFSKDAIFQSLEVGRAHDRWDEIDGLRMPCLLVKGENSTDLSQIIFDEILSRNPSIKGVVIENSGHWVHFDQPQLFIDVLQSFLGN
jgi:pimeloyl-ACP methyl ester carboxylesterase